MTVVAGGAGTIDPQVRPLRRGGRRSEDIDVEAGAGAAMIGARSAGCEQVGVVGGGQRSG
jgi:hypothetical protein